MDLWSSLLDEEAVVPEIIAEQDVSRLGGHDS
jgi:hypothetical protein